MNSPNQQFVVNCRRTAPFVQTCSIKRGEKTIYRYECYSIGQAKCDFAREMIGLMLDIQSKTA